MNQGTEGKEMARKNLLKSESAAAVAIAAVLLLGLAFTVISIVKLNYAPEWKIDAERDFSYDAWSNMEDVKTRADLFTQFMSADINYPYGLSATVPFSMGGGDVPVFEPSKSNSKLAVNTEECTMNITFGNHTLDPVDCGGVTYYSENRQYPDQIFRYENGALILAQGDNSQMKRDPLFNIQKNMSNYNYTITINAISLTGDTESISSSTLTPLRLTGCSVDPVLNSDDYNQSIDSLNLSISTRYTDAWTTYLNNTVKDAGLKYGTNYTINSTDDCVCLSFIPSGNNYSIYVNKTVLCAELGRTGGGGNLPGGSLSGGSGNVMKLNQWYYFDNVSDSNYKQYLDYLKNYNSGVNLSINSTGKELNDYTASSNVFPFSLNNNPSELTFRFSNFTTFESKPSSVTVVMIYNPTVKDPVYQNMSIAGKPVPVLTGKSKDTWYLYNQTVNVTGMSINYSSDLTLYIKIGEQNSKYINIDYLAVRLD
jgi:hypothetical protein